MILLRPNLLVASLLAAIAACGGPPADRHSIIMDKIEKQVRLPAGALRYEEYSRYYVDSGKDLIAAAYIAQDASFRDFAARSCAMVKEKVFPCLGNGKAELAPSGARMWLPTVNDLPIPDGGGCRAVTFLYRPSTNTFSKPECNGPY